LIERGVHSTATLCFLQEVLGSNLAGMPVKRPAKDAPFPLHILAGLHVDIKAVKMAIYGFLVSAPIGHVLIGTLQSAFSGKTGTGAKIAQLLANNLLVSPIQTSGKTPQLSLWVSPYTFLNSLPCLYGYHQWR
jgi:peroxisomal membrane protein 2